MWGNVVESGEQQYIRHHLYTKSNSDIDNVMGKPNYKEFIDHRHDQSIFSVLTKKYNLYFQIISIYNYIIKFVVPARKIIFIDFILSPSLFFNIIFKLRLLPFLILRDEFIATKNVDLDFREDLFNKIKINKASSGLSSEFWKLLCVSMPLSYVEEFQEIVSYGSKVYGHPVRVILLRNIYSKDSSKIWVADALQRGSKLAISQHGGGYGLSEYDFNSYHEAGVADLFLSWYKSTKKNVIQVPSFKYIKSTNRSKKSYGLLVNCTWAKVFHHYGDSPIGEQVQKNTDDQIIFLNHLQGKASENMRVRQSHDINNYENIIKQYEKSGFQSLVENNIKFNHLILEAKIVVISCIGTVWLETLMNNIPTVVFFDPLVCYFNPKVNNYIEKFKKFGIIHNSPKSAAQHINNIYPDIEKWWNDPELQSLRQEFCRDFGVTEKTWARKYIAPINSILD